MLEVTTLTPGDQTALAVAQLIAGFLAQAQQTLDLALYDIEVDGPEAGEITRALEHAAGRGVRVRLAYNLDHPGPIPVPPPPRTIPELVESLPVATRAISGIPDLMHHKYAICDGASVLTGSTNWTEASWTLQENLFARVDSAVVARAYAADFEQLWRSGVVAETGDVDAEATPVGDATVRAWFTPGRATSLAHRIARRIDRAQHRVRVCSPVISSGPILGTLAQVASDRSVDLAGVVDATQIADVIQQWHLNGNSAWKIPLLRAVLERAPFSGKQSTPWQPGSLHDFMHAKVTVADDTVFLGSFNLSRSGERNAENVLEIEDPALADRLASYIDAVRARYPAVELPNLSA